MTMRPGQRERDLAALVRALRDNGRLLATLARRSEADGLLPQSRGPTFHRPADIAAYLGPEMAHLPQEQLRVVLLDRRNRLIDDPLVYQGGQTETSVRLAECFRDAVRSAAAALVLVHCHPSGDPTPSPDDIQLTREAGEAGELLGIAVLDHLVIAADGFVSLREAALYVPQATKSSTDPFVTGSSTHAQPSRGASDPVESRRDDWRMCRCGCRGRLAVLDSPASQVGPTSEATELVQDVAA